MSMLNKVKQLEKRIPKPKDDQTKKTEEFLSGQSVEDLRTIAFPVEGEPYPKHIQDKLRAAGLL